MADQDSGLRYNLTQYKAQISHWQSLTLEQTSRIQAI